MAIAPFHATVLTLGPEPELRKAADDLVAALAEAGVEVLYDERDERAGVKFKDADLVGIPLRIAIGKKGLAGGNAEWKLRDGGAVELVPLSEVAKKAAALVQAATSAR
jgi:prolyl-tRNA synthetase